MTAPLEAAPQRRLDPPVDRRRLILLLAGLSVGLLAAELDSAIFATALPTVVGELDGIDRQLWVGTAYILAGTIAMPVAGRLGDRFGRRPVVVVGLLVFVVGSVLGGWSTNMTTLIAARAVQGLGGGGLLILVQAVVADLVPARERVRVISAVGAVFAVAALLGPVLGGWLAATVGWRWAFWINLPLGAIALGAALRWLPRSTWPGRRPVPEVPSSPIGWLAQPTPSVALGAGLVVGLAVFGTITYLPTLLQMVTGLDPTRAGLWMLSLIAGLGLATVLAAQVISRTGRPKPFLVGGPALAAVAMLLLAAAGPGSGFGQLGGALFLLGFGTGCAWEVLVTVVQNAVPAGQVGTATAINGFVREVGVLLGTGIVGAAFTARLTAGLASSAIAPAAHSLTPARLAALPADARAAVAVAYADALTPVFAALAPLLGLTALALLLVRSEPLPAAGATVAGATAGAHTTGGATSGAAR